MSDNRKQREDMPNEELCSICHDVLNQRCSDMLVAKLACQHLFHSKCIQRWLHEMRKCPLCRQTALLTDIKKIGMDHQQMELLPPSVFKEEVQFRPEIKFRPSAMAYNRYAENKRRQDQTAINKKADYSISAVNLGNSSYNSPKENTLECKLQMILAQKKFMRKTFANMEKIYAEKFG